MVASWINFITQLKTLEMKKNYTIILVLFAFTYSVKAQVTDDFESYTDGYDLVANTAWGAWDSNSFLGSDGTGFYTPFEGSKMGITGNDVTPTYGVFLVANDYVMTVYTKIDADQNWKRTRTIKVSTGNGELATSTVDNTDNGWVKTDLLFTIDANIWTTVTLNHGNGSGLPMGVDAFSIAVAPTATTIDQNSFQFGVFPNPVANVLSIQTEEELTSVEIVNLMGRSIQVLQSNVKNIDVSSLAPGVYVVKLTNLNGGVSLKKIIKN